MKKLSLQELNRVDIPTFKTQAKTPLVLILDNVRSALNVGSAFRTADAFALEKIILCGITAKPPHREILKTAIGATDSVDWIYMEDSAEAVLEIQKEGYKVFAVEQAEGSTSLERFSESGNEEMKTGLVFGNEVNGVSESVMEKVDGCIEVPQFGTKHSLNISVCVGVVVWELFKHWKYKI